MSPDLGRSERREHRAAVRRELSSLIRIANNEESEHARSHLSTAITVAASRSAELIAGQLRMLGAIERIAQAGMSLDQIESELVGPVVEDGIVGSVAWAAIRDVMSTLAGRQRRGSTIS